ncbi:sigma-70 family RNA polymerase sigma factor [soil metagenome]
MSLPESDEQLIQRMAEQDEAALLELHNRYAHQLVAFIGRMQSDPAQVMQSALDTFVYAWSHAEHFDPAKTSAKAWLVTVCHRLTLNRLSDRDLDPMPLRHWDVPARANDPADEPEALHLSQDARDFLELAFYRGLSQQQVAEATNTPLSTVQAELRDVLRGLRTKGTGGKT